jgi:hypothetical protein
MSCGAYDGWRGQPGANWGSKPRRFTSSPTSPLRLRDKPRRGSSHAGRLAPEQGCNPHTADECTPAPNLFRATSRAVSMKRWEARLLTNSTFLKNVAFLSHATSVGVETDCRRQPRRRFGPGAVLIDASSAWHAARQREPAVASVQIRSCLGCLVNFMTAPRL